MKVRIAATVFTDQIETVQKWLEEYFACQTHIDWKNPDDQSGKVICRHDDLELTICGAYERSAEIQLLVDDISELCERFERDGIDHHVDRDTGERPVIHFPAKSPFSAFVIEEEK